MRLFIAVELLSETKSVLRSKSLRCFRAEADLFRKITCI